MRAYLGELALDLDTDMLAGAIEKALPPFVASGAGLSHKEQAVRLGVKASMRALLGMIDGEIVKRRLPLPRPTCGRRDDPIAYTVNYLLALALLGLDAQEWELAYVEADNGDRLAITGVGARARERHRATPATADDAGNDTAGDACGAGSKPATSLADSRHDGLRQDDVCEASGV